MSDTPRPAVPVEQEVPPFGPPVGTEAAFNPRYPSTKQRVVENHSIGFPCECAELACGHGGGKCGAVPAVEFMLSGWPDSLILCEACMPKPVVVTNVAPPRQEDAVPV